MKPTDSIISIAIHNIIAAYTALPYNGFRLHIEDKPMEGTQVVGKQQSSVKEISEDELPESVRKALGLGAHETIDSILNELGYKPKLMGLAIPSEIIGWDGEKWDHMILFYEPIIEAAKDMDDLKRLIHEFVKHEWRHGCQFNWLRAHGIDIISALQKENETEYGHGPLESDAHYFQWDKADELDVAMASFIA